MRRLVIAGVVVATLATAIAGWARRASSSGAPAYEPALTDGNEHAKLVSVSG